MGGGAALAKMLSTPGAVHGFSAAQMMAAAQQLQQQAPADTTYQQQQIQLQPQDQGGEVRQGQQQLQDEQPAVQAVAPGAQLADGAMPQEAVAPEYAPAPAPVYAPPASTQYAAAVPAAAQEYVWDAGSGTWVHNPLYAPAAPVSAPPATPSTQPQWASSPSFQLVNPHPRLDAEILAEEQKTVTLIILVAILIAVPCCVCNLVGRAFFSRHSNDISEKAAAAEVGGAAVKAPLLKDSWSSRGTPLDDKLQEHPEGPTKLEASSSSSLMPSFLQQGFDSVQGGFGVLTGAAGRAFDQNVGDDLPYSVVVSFRRDARGCMGMDAARCLARPSLSRSLARSLALSRTLSLARSLFLSLSLSRALLLSLFLLRVLSLSRSLPSHSLSRCLLRALSLPLVLDVHARVCSPCVLTSMQRCRSVSAYLSTYETQPQGL